jgi:hypothetical protein
MNRRHLLKALFAVPVAAIAAPLAAALAPKPFADGGIVPPIPYIVGQCEIPVTTKAIPSHNPGTLCLEIHCDTSALNRDLSTIRKDIERHIRHSVSRRLY